MTSLDPAITTLPALGLPRAEPRRASATVAALSLARRELVRFFRQPHRVVGAVVTPLVFWLLIGAGVGRSFSAGTQNESFLHYFFPGTLLMVVLFTAIFSTISTIEDRREGFLQGVLVSPVPRVAIVLGKVLGGASLAFSQGLVFLLLSPLLGLRPSLPNLALAVLLLALTSLALTALGLLIAWRMTSTQGFHAVMNLLLMPMWFLSGALFPPSGAMGPLRYLMYANPLTWSLSGLRQALQNTGSPAVPLAVTAVFAAVLLAATTALATRPSPADLT